MKNCNECVFFQRSTNIGCGRCGYPVPEWLRIVGCGYIASPDYSGQDCATFKSRADVVTQESQSTQLSSNDNG